MTSERGAGPSVRHSIKMQSPHSFGFRNSMEKRYTKVDHVQGQAAVTVCDASPEEEGLVEVYEVSIPAEKWKNGSSLLLILVLQMNEFLWLFCLSSIIGSQRFHSIPMLAKWPGHAGV